MNEETKLSLLLRVAIATAFACVAVKWMVDQLDPTRDKKNKAKQQAKALMHKLKIKSSIQVMFIYKMINLNLFEINNVIFKVLCIIQFVYKH